MQRSPTKIILRIHIRTCGNKQFNDFLLTFLSRIMQRSSSIIILRIHIRPISQIQLDGFDVSVFGGLVN